MAMCAEASHDMRFCRGMLTTSEIKRRQECWPTAGIWYRTKYHISPINNIKVAVAVQQCSVAVLTIFTGRLEPCPGRAVYFVNQVAREELGEECDYEKEAANQVTPDLCFELRRVKP